MDNTLLKELIPLVSDYGLWIVFFGMMVEGTTMIIVTGILCYLGLIVLKEAIPVAILGAIIGDQFWYYLGKNYSDRVLKRFPKLEQRIKKIEPAVQKKGTWLSFGGRFVYGGAILFPVGLGTYKYPHKKFTLFDTMGVTLWSFAGILLGYLFGSGAEKFFGEIEEVWHFVLLVAVVIIVIWIIKYYFYKKNNTGTLKH